MVQGEGSDGKRKYVALDEGGCEESPRVYEGKLGNEVQIRDDDVRVGRPLLVADGGAQDALQTQRDEQDARDGWDVYSRRHRGGLRFGRWVVEITGKANGRRPQRRTWDAGVFR